MRDNKRLILIWALILATAWVGSILYRDIVPTADAPRAITPRGDFADFEKQNIELFARISLSVAYIFTQVKRRDFLGVTRQSESGTGSGFIWDGAGHVVTNFHVIQGASNVAVKLDTGEAIPASIAGVAPEYDLAVLRLRSRGSGLQPIPVGTSGDLKVGQAVFAIGNPFGLSRTLTTGSLAL